MLILIEFYGKINRKTASNLNAAGENLSQTHLRNRFFLVKGAPNVSNKSIFS